MSSNIEIKAEAYAQGRIDAGEPAFMDRDDFTSNVTVGAFVHQVAQAGDQVPLITAWATFMATGGRTVIETETQEVEDEMATTDEVERMRAALDICMSSRTFMGGPTIRCSLRLGHRASHAANLRGVIKTWTTEESDQALADRVHYVPASTYSTEVTRTRYPVSVATDDQVAADLSATRQEV